MIEPASQPKGDKEIVYLTLGMLDDVPLPFHPLIAKLMEQGLVKVVLDGPDQIM